MFNFSSLCFILNYFPMPSFEAIFVKQERYYFSLSTQPLEVNLLPSLLCSCLVPMLVYPVMICNIKLTSIFFPLGEIIGMVRMRTIFILSTRFREIGGAGMMKLSCIVPTSVTHV